MGWVQEANKLGTYHSTVYGYRIYCTTSTVITITEQGIESVQGKYLAINKNGVLIESRPLEFIWAAIEKKQLEDYYGGTFD